MKTKILLGLLIIMMIASPLCAGGGKETASPAASSAAKKVLNTTTPFSEDALLVNDANPKYGGTLRRTLPSAPTAFNLYGVLDNSTYIVMAAFLAGLVDQHPVTNELRPALAERWEIAPDNKSITFYLRDIKWSDGVQFSADDIIFTFYHFVMNKNARGNSVDRFTAAGKPVTWEKINDKTIKAYMPAPMPGLLSSLAQAYIYPKHKLENKIDPAKPDSVNSVWLTNAPISDFASTGPFMLSEYIVDQKVVLKRNPNFWKVDTKGNPLPYFDALEYLVVKDPQVQVAKFMSGEIDYMTIASADYPNLKAREVSGNAPYQLFLAEPTLNVPSPIHVSFNMDTAKPKLKELFRNVDFRVAVELALDRNRIIEEVYSGLAVFGGTPVLPSNKAFYNPAVEKIRRAYDMKVAIAALDKLGLKDSNNDGIREFADKTPIEFVIMSSTTKEEQDVAYILSEDLKKLGLKVSLQILDPALTGQKYAAGEFEVGIRAFGNQPDPVLRQAIWQPGQQLYYFHRSTMGATPATPNKAEFFPWEVELYDVFEKGAVTMDPVARKKIYDRYQEIYAQYVPVIFVVKGMNIFGTQKTIGNSYQTKDGMYYYSDWTAYRK